MNLYKKPRRTPILHRGLRGKQSGFALPLVILIVVVLIIAGGAGYYSYTSYNAYREIKTPEIIKPEQVIDKTVDLSRDEVLQDLSSKDLSTEDWKIYRKEEYGFEVKYPKKKDWRVMEIKPTDQDWKSKILIASNQYRFVLEIFEDKSSLNDYSHLWSFIEKFYGTDRNHLPIDNAKEFYIDSKPAIEISYTERAEDPRLAIPAIIVITSNKGFLYRISYVVNSYGSQILSTFKFIEIDKTADWKVYRNEDFGFEIKYFADWKIAEYFSSSPIGGPFIGTSIRQQSLPIRIDIKKDFERSYILEKYPDFPEEWADYAGCSMNILTSANIDEDFNKNFGKECQQYKTKDIEVGGSNAIKCEPGTGPAVWNAVWLLKNNKGIAFIFSSLAPQDCEGMFNQILSTFKFIK